MSSPANWMIAHGTLGSPERNWFPWLTWQGLQRDIVVRVPRLPTPVNQSFTSWAEAFEKQTPALTTQTILIGHSTGAPFILQYLQRTEKKVRAVHLASGFSAPFAMQRFPEMIPLVRSFVDFKFDWIKIRALAASFDCYHGDNDDIVPFALGQDIADNLGAPMHSIAGGRHLNTEARFFEFPQLLERLLGGAVAGQPT